MSNIGSVAMSFAFKPANNMYSGFKTPSSSKSTNYGSSSFTPNTKSSGAYEKVCAILLLIGILLLVIVPFISFITINTGAKHFESISLFSLIFDESISLVDIIKGYSEMKESTGIRGGEYFPFALGSVLLPLVAGFYLIVALYSLVMAIIAFASRSYVLLKKTAVLIMTSIMAVSVAISLLPLGYIIESKKPVFFEMKLSVATMITLAVVIVLFGFVVFFSIKKNKSFVNAYNSNLYHKHIPVYISTTILMIFVMLFFPLSQTYYGALQPTEMMPLTFGAIILMPAILFKAIHDFCASFKVMLIYSHMTSSEISKAGKVRNVNIIASVIFSVLTFFFLLISESVSETYNFGIFVFLINAFLMMITFITYKCLDKKY